jgi:aminoglycoside phosphotransferase (APT) family kinase protein
MRWLPVLCGALDDTGLTLPVPVREGLPGPAYPFPWSIVRWVEGETLLQTRRPVDEAEAAEVLARLLDALWSVPALADVPRNPHRGVPLTARSATLVDRLERLPDDLAVSAVAKAWHRALRAPSWSGPPVWVHGDLHPGNLVARGGRLTGVIDWGDLTSGDPATDLSVAWMLLGVEARARLRTDVAVDDATWARARGNALAHAVAVLVSSADDPTMEAMGRRTLAAVLAEEDPTP